VVGDFWVWFRPKADIDDRSLLTEIKGKRALIKITIVMDFKC